MTTKFTPGPWVYSPSRRTHDCVIHAEGADDEKYGYMVEGEGGVIGSSEWIWVSDANAHLIAAAPELYEALQEACTSLVIAADQARDAAKTDSRWSGVDEKLMRYAREGQAALTKARGETQ